MQPFKKGIFVSAEDLWCPGVLTCKSVFTAILLAETKLLSKLISNGLFSNLSHFINSFFIIIAFVYYFLLKQVSFTTTVGSGQLNMTLYRGNIFMIFRFVESLQRRQAFRAAILKVYLSVSKTQKSLLQINCFFSEPIPYKWKTVS